MSTIINRRTVRGWELRQGVEQFAHQTANHLGLNGISIRWKPIPTAAINGKGTMILAAVKDDAVISRATLVRYVGFVLHELLHRKYSRFDVNGGDHYLARLHNAVEDAWIERRAIAEGLTGNIKGVLTELLQQIVDESIAQVNDWSDPGVYPFALAVYARGYGVQVPLAQGLEPIFAEATRRIDACKHSIDTLRVAEWVFDQLKQQQQPEQQPEQGEEQGQEQGQGQGEGQGEGQKQADGQGQGEGQGEGEGEGEGSGKGEGQSQGQSQGKGKNQVGAARAPALNQKARRVEPTLGSMEVGNAGTYWDGAGVGDRGQHLRSSPIHQMNAKPVPGKLRHEVRRLFDNSGVTLFARNRKAGSVNVHALSRVAVTDRLFKQRRDIEGVDSAVVICLDVSGSMGLLLNTVVSVGAMLVDTLASAQVQVAVTSFGSVSSVVTPFGTPAAKVRGELSRLGCGGDTNDYAAVRQAADMLLPRTEERKVIFVVTDGVGDRDRCKEQCRAAQALGITVIGVGIQQDVSNIYPNAIRIESVDDLGKTVFNQVKLAA